MNDGYETLSLSLSMLSISVGCCFASRCGGHDVSADYSQIDAIIHCSERIHLLNQTDSLR